MNAYQTEYVVFDVETTGLSPQGGDRIVEIAAIKVKEQKVIDTFHFLVNPQRDLPPEATRINNITQEMVAHAPPASEVLPRMLDFIGGSCLAGHNVGFDLKFLCYELSFLGRKLRKETPAVDTLKMAKKFLSHLTSHKLGNVAHFLGASVNETHRALADVEITVCVLNRLLTMAQEQGIVSFKDCFKAFGVEKPNFKIEQAVQGSLFQ